MKIPERWTFEDAGVAEGFDAHVREQLPWYDLVSFAIAHIARHYVLPGSLVYDLGAATGNVGRAIQGTLEERGARLISIEPSKEMVARYTGPGEVVITNAEDYEYQPYSLAILNLTLQFVPVPERWPLLHKLQRAAVEGGGIILIDKVEGDGGYISTVLYRLTLAGKLESGATPDEVLIKELSLGGVQRALNPHLLEDFTEFFRYGVFGGYVWERSARRA